MPLQRAQALLARGETVVLDASWTRRGPREQAARPRCSRRTVPPQPLPPTSEGRAGQALRFVQVAERPNPGWEPRGARRTLSGPMASSARAGLTEGFPYGACVFGEAGHAIDGFQQRR